MFEYHISSLDLVIALFVYLVLLAIAYSIKRRNIAEHPHYKLYLTVFHAKILGGLTFALIYALYYGGGDSTAYWMGGERMKNLFFKNPGWYFSELFGNQSWESYYSYYDGDTGFPPSWLYRSPRHFFVCRLTSLICFVIPKSFFGVTLFYSFFSFLGIWKLYEVFIRNFPAIKRNFKWAILFVPSLLFWCSGVMKDTIVLTCLAYIVYYTDRFFDRSVKVSRLRFFLAMGINIWLIYNAKPYVLIAFAPGWLLWVNYHTISRIRSKLLKYYLIPVITIGTFVAGTSIYLQTSGSEFAADNVFEKALITRNDFSSNKTYGTNRIAAEKIQNINTGTLIASIPESVMRGLLQPFIWEARTPIVFLSGLENTIIMLLLIYALWKLRVIGVVGLIRKHPLILLSLVFTLVLAFFIGFTTLIFGALVRFRTPFLPFFISFLFISLNHINVRQEVRGKEVQLA